MTHPSAGNDDPAAETAQRLTQLLLIATNIGTELLRLKAARAEDRARRDLQSATAARAQQATLRAAAAARWAATFDQKWLARAATLDVAAAWGASVPWAAHGDPEAQSAMTAAEGRLRDLHPDAMGIYDDARRAGADPQTAMHAAAPHMAADADIYQWTPRTGQAYRGRPGPTRAPLGADAPRPERAPVRLVQQSYPRPLHGNLSAPPRPAGPNPVARQPITTPSRARNR